MDKTIWQAVLEKLTREELELLKKKNSKCKGGSLLAKIRQKKRKIIETTFQLHRKAYA